MENTDFLIYFGVILASFLLAAALTPLIIMIAKKYRITDDPEAALRKVHVQPTPLLGGWSVFLATTLVVLAAKLFNFANFSQIPLVLLLGIIGASAVIIIGGTLDDKYNLKPQEQIIFPIAAVMIVLVCGLRVAFITNPLGNLGSVIYFGQWLGLISAGLWLLGMMYTTKFLDGLDGLVAGIATIAAFFIFLVSLNWDVPLSATGIWALALLGASLGFLIYNWQPAKIFLGEGGSVLIGFTLGVLSIVSGSKIITTLLVMGLPALDVLFVIVKRLLEKKSPFHGDRNHLHYQLLTWGLSKKQVVLIFYCLAIGFGALGAISSSYGKMVLFICLILVIVLVSLGLKFKQKPLN